MRYTLGLAVGLIMLPMAALAQSNPLVGTWSLVSINEDHQGKITKPLGDTPMGQIIYAANQQMSVVLTSGDREKKPGNPMMPVGPAIAYFGAYAVSGANISLHIVASTFPNFGGTDQTGSFTISGDTLTLVRQIVGATEPFTSTLTFARVK